MTIEAGYVIYNPVYPSIKYSFDRSISGRGAEIVSTKHNNNRTELKTFGRVPYVYYAGETDFVNFQLTTTFHYNEKTEETARSQVDRFKEMVGLRKTLIVENSQGQSFKCDVNIIDETSPILYVEKDFDYIEMQVECVQIDF